MILITGGCGFVGSNISVYLKKNLKNAQISSLDNFSRHGSKINFKRLKKNNIKKVVGILNGTTNYILTEMEKTKQSFKEVLKLFSASAL